MCPLVYADIITGRTSKSATADTAVATAAAAGNREASSTESGRVDHIAVKGPCRETIAKLTDRQGLQEAAAVGKGIGRGEGFPFLFIVNFQVRSPVYPCSSASRTRFRVDVSTHYCTVCNILNLGTISTTASPIVVIAFPRPPVVSKGICSRRSNDSRRSTNTCPPPPPSLPALPAV